MSGANEAIVVWEAIGNNDSDQEVIDRTESMDGDVILAEYSKYMDGGGPRRGDDSHGCGVCYRYWVRKLRDEDRPQHLATMMVEWDKAVGAWHHMEEQTGLITQLCHMGPKVSYRKVLSYDGVPEDSCDQGNWVYVVCLRNMLCLFPESDWRNASTKQLNDETAGDILEAIWGLLWHRENQGPLASVIADSLVPTQQLQRYCKCMTRVVLKFVHLWPEFLKSQEWPSSRELAHALI